MHFERQKKYLKNICVPHKNKNSFFIVCWLFKDYDKAQNYYIIQIYIYVYKSP